MGQTQGEKEKGGRERLIKSILNAGNEAFDPKKSESARAQAIRDFDDVIQRQAQLASSYVLLESDWFPGPRLSTSFQR